MSRKIGQKFCNANVRKSPRTQRWTHCVKDIGHTDDHVDRWDNHRKQNQPDDRSA